MPLAAASTATQSAATAAAAAATATATASAAAAAATAPAAVAETAAGAAPMDAAQLFKDFVQKAQGRLPGQQASLLCGISTHEKLERICKSKELKASCGNIETSEDLARQAAFPRQA